MMTSARANRVDIIHDKGLWGSSRIVATFGLEGSPEVVATFNKLDVQFTEEELLGLTKKNMLEFYIDRVTSII